jgi:thiamine biosynthesis lipoprotein
MSTPARLVHVEQIWGTVITIDIRLFQTAKKRAVVAVADVVDWLQVVDDIFSPFRTDSQVCQLARGELDPGQASAQVRDVIARCERIKKITDGAFDPWSVPSGFDPSGLVKGWATDRAASILLDHGCNDFMINAGGDVVVRGQSAPEELWSIGIQHPDERGQICDVVSVTNCAIATSGNYERGEHIRHPQGHSVLAKSATVIGPDAATADALATAALVAGKQSFSWLSRLTNYEFKIVVDNQLISAKATS